MTKFGTQKKDTKQYFVPQIYEVTYLLMHPNFYLHFIFETKDQIAVDLIPQKES